MDAGVVMFHGLRKQSIEKELEYNKKIFKIVSSYIICNEGVLDEEDEHDAYEVLHKVESDLETNEKALAECIKDLAKATDEYLKEHGGV